MKRNIMYKWIKALKSGKYKQTTGELKNKNGYCCLGVLCEIKAKEQKKKFYEHKNGGVLSETQMKWSGIKSQNGKCKRTDLVYMNDYLKYSFSEIADFIKKNYKLL